MVSTMKILGILKIGGAAAAALQENRSPAELRS
jgi:hypothetical protein